MVAAVDIDVPGKVLRLNITLDEALLARIDRAAADAGESRSGWLATAARQRLGGERAAQHTRFRSPRRSCGGGRQSYGEVPSGRKQWQGRAIELFCEGRRREGRPRG